jgi:hypothetical protein
MVVDPDHPDLELVSDAVGPAHVIRPDGPGEAKLCGVGEFDRLLLGVERHHADDGAEDLLLSYAHTVLHVHEDRRRIEVALVVRRIGDTVPACGERRSLLDTDANVLLDALQLLLGDERSHLGRLVLRIPEDDPVRPFYQLLYELVVHGPLHYRSGALHAGLSPGNERGEEGPAHGVVQVGVLEDQTRRLAPELRADADQVLPGDGGDLLAGLRTARQVYLPDTAVRR